MLASKIAGRCKAGDAVSEDMLPSYIFSPFQILKVICFWWPLWPLIFYYVLIPCIYCFFSLLLVVVGWFVCFLCHSLLHSHVAICSLFSVCSFAFSFHLLWSLRTNLATLLLSRNGLYMVLPAEYISPSTLKRGRSHHF